MARLPTRLQRHLRARMIAELRSRLRSEQRDTLRRWVRRLSRPAWLGTLRRTTPLSDSWGYDRGTPVDRYYIDHFLEEHQHDIRGHVLEVRDGGYTERYGRAVTRADVLDIDAQNPRATIVADLSDADGVAADQFDCFILTQTLQFVLDTRTALRHAHRILRPGGVLLATLPVVSRIERRHSTDYWRFTEASCVALFGDVFGTDTISVRSCGNVLASIAFLAGMSYEELSRHELDAQDRYFPLIITVRAVKR